MRFKKLGHSTRRQKSQRALMNTTPGRRELERRVPRAPTKEEIAAMDPAEVQAIIENEKMRMSAIRMQLLSLHPFWGFMIAQLELEADIISEFIGATDGVSKIYYNPFRTKHLSIGQVGFLLVHEVGHGIYKTFPRKKNRDHQLWNRATDYAINAIAASLENAGMPGRKLYEVIPGIMLDPRFDGMAAEAIYQVLLDEKQDEEKNGKRKGKPRRQGGQKGQGGEGGEGGEGSEGEGEEGEGGEGGEGEGEEGSGSMGKAGDDVAYDHGDGFDGHIEKPLSNAQKQDMARRMNDATNFAKASKQQGNIPGDALRAIQFWNSRVDWARILRQYLQEALGRDDYDLRRFSKRYAVEDLIMPGRGGEEVPLVVVALDTSGSMDEKSVSKAMADIRKLTKNVADVYVIVADAEITEVYRDLPAVERWLDTSKAKGGGGTSHVPVFNHIKEKRLKPTVFIGLTDLYSDVNTIRKPLFPVIWVVPEVHGHAPWGKIIPMAAEPEEEGE